MAGTFRIEALVASHDRASFSYGVDALDAYFHQQVTIPGLRQSITAAFSALDRPEITNAASRLKTEVQLRISWPLLLTSRSTLITQFE
jgi:hypothetical protein